MSIPSLVPLANYATLTCIGSLIRSPVGMLVEHKLPSVTVKGEVHDFYKLHLFIEFEALS